MLSGRSGRRQINFSASLSEHLTKSYMYLSFWLSCFSYFSILYVLLARIYEE